MILHVQPRYGIDTFSDKHSITHVGEKLDIASMLKRSQMGILDLDQFNLPRMHEIPGQSVDDPATDERLDMLLHAPSTSDRLFGQSVEDAQADLRRLGSMMHKVEPKNDPPKNDPPKNDPPKNDPPKNDPQPTNP